MKAPLTFLPFILIFIFIRSYLSTAAQLPDPLLDIDGNNLQSGVNYYVLPVLRGFGGGLTLSTFGNNNCLRGVIQEMLEVKPGIPVAFAPVNHTKRGVVVVRTSTDLNIKFSPTAAAKMGQCSHRQSYMWKVEFEQTSGKYFIVIGGVEGNPEVETVSNWFKIEKLDRDYKLVFCPSVCKFCKVICKDVGVFMQLERRRLALSDFPLRVQLKKA